MYQTRIPPSRLAVSRKRDSIPAFNRVRADLQSIKQLYKTDAEAELADVGQSFNHTVYKVFTILFVTLLLAIIAVRLIHRSRMLLVSERANRELSAALHRRSTAATPSRS